MTTWRTIFAGKHFFPDNLFTNIMVDFVGQDCLESMLSKLQMADGGNIQVDPDPPRCCSITILNSIQLMEILEIL